jgi:HKD family nuclease
MTQVNHIAQPSSRTTLEAIESILSQVGIEAMDIAAAYITSGGLNDLVVRSTATLGATWTGLEKRWLTSFDYSRTEPVALEAILSMPASTVRVYDAAFCLAHGGMPRVPFHPKAYLMRSAQRDYALIGSGNLSRSGLSRGIEAGLAISVDRLGHDEPMSITALRALRDWYAATWAAATPLNAALLTDYAKVFESAANLKKPTPTEDDVASSDASAGAISSANLQKLRVCRNFWIEAGNITKNRGPLLPGSQLMMKRLSRVFFGFISIDLPKNTQIGNVRISFNAGNFDNYSMTYSDNNMDKLNLPIPGAGGPVAYDGQLLIFRQLGPREFDLTLGTPADKANWLKRSRAIDGAFKMTSGREWGVF